jgi:hypothetical protein
MGKSSASRFFIELEEHGFIVSEKLSSFNQKRLSIEWRLTELRNDLSGSLPTKEFARWGLERGRPKEQKPVPLVERIGPIVGLPAEGASAQVVTRPTAGPAGVALSAPQSHRRATSTSSPEGRQSPTPAMMVTHSQSRPEIREREEDPVVRAILEMFPGATVRRARSVP